MIEIPLSQSGPPDAFADAVQAHRAAVEQHMLGKPGVPAPTAPPLVHSLIARVPDTGPVAQRGPDRIVVPPYQIIDDLPKTPEVVASLQVLRDMIRGLISR